MPLYRYKCENCGEEFVSLVTIGKEKEIRCKKCGNSQLKKLIPKSFIGRNKEGPTPGMSSCSTCRSTSCDSCGR